MLHISRWGRYTTRATIFFVAIQFIISSGILFAQDPQVLAFTKIPGGPISSEGGIAGAAFIDYDADGDLDIFGVGSNPTPNRALYRNDGNDVFTDVTDNLIVTDPGAMLGVAWADYDNDGDVDLITGGVPATLYQNDESGNFTRITTGEIVTGNPRGWSPSWADIDNDGDVDFFMTHPAGFVSGGGFTPNVYFLNDGPPNYTFTQVTGTEINSAFAPFTIGSWSDYDLDGDQDLFIGAGPANGTVARDFFYENQLSETGSADFIRIEQPRFASDTRDGQTVNWIDVENDGDLDMYVTSWGAQLGGVRNDLYLNDNGIFIKVTEGGLVSDADISLANIWGDFDNDADVDVFIANRGLNKLYLNNGDGTFEQVTEGEIANDAATNWGATAGDYDNDGDLDIFVPALSSGQRHSLFRNDLDNGNSWIKLNLSGTTSNGSGIGAKIFLATTIGGDTVSQIREVSSQNSFLGHNSLEIHIGLGDATTAEQIRIEWPSGVVDSHLFVDINQIYTATEGGALESNSN